MNIASPAFAKTFGTSLFQKIGSRNTNYKSQPIMKYMVIAVNCVIIFTILLIKMVF